jgi:hypothetical protein
MSASIDSGLNSSTKSLDVPLFARISLITTGT